MNTLSLIGTGAAFLNYRKAKAEYDALLMKRQEMIAAYEQMYIDPYNNSKNNEAWDAIEEQSAGEKMDWPDGLRVTTTLRICNLVGKLFKARTVLVLWNTSKTPIHIYSAECTSHIFNIPIKLYTIKNEAVPNSKIIDRIIKPGEVLEIELNYGLTSIGDKMSELRNMICAACGKKLITSCRCPVYVLNAQTTNGIVYWIKDNKTTSFYFNEKPGSVIYNGETGIV